MSQDRIWDHFQNQDAESFADGYARQRALARMVQAGEQVLNIGVGAGDLERLAAARGAVVHVLDPNETSVEEIRQRLDLGERARSGYADRIPFDSGRFDVVLMTEVVEHLALEVLPAALGEVWRVLRAGGRLVGTVPYREELARNVVVCPDCGHRFHRWGHVQSFDVDSLRQVLASRFDPVTIRRAYFPPWRTLSWKGKLETAAMLFFRIFGARLADEKLLFVARKPAQEPPVAGR